MSPVSFQLSSGNVYDDSYTIKTLSNVELYGSNILVDKAYNSIEIREFIENKGATYTIPPKSNTKEKWRID